MLPAHLIERHFFHLDRERVDILLELRSLIAREAPDAMERLHPSWISYYQRGYSKPHAVCICIIHIDTGCLRLAFIRGALLPDPKHLLEGESRYKRWTRIQSYDEAPWDDLGDLIRTSADLDPYSLPA